MKTNLIRIFAVLAKVALVVLLAYLAFFSFIAVHEWAGHILADEIIFARHGTTLARFEVIVQWFSVSLQDGRWSVALVPFRIGGKVVCAIPGDPITIADWESGFEKLMGTGITALIALVTLAVLNLRKDLPRFP